LLNGPGMEPRLALAQLRVCFVFVTLAVAGCSESHMMGADDAGTARTDGGAHSTDAPFFAPDACRCDAGAPPDSGLGPDGGVFSCDVDDARGETCPDAVCDGPDSYAWDGERCFRIDCGTCGGSDCGTLAHSEAECLARHASCVPEQCRATGGEWLFFTEECEHYRCGQPQLASCLVGMPVCDCGSGRSWVEGVGCADDPACPEVDPLPPETLCPATGGTWTNGICCHTTCGQLCDLPCAAPGCVCGPLEVFDAIRGCVPAAECFEREVGETCGFAGTRCGEGVLCCQRCGGAGCDPDMICQPPVCDADPTIDECGNNLLAP
jgi:hypothetical protein